MTDTTYYMPGQNLLICMGTLSTDGVAAEYFPSGNTITCDSEYLIMNINSGVYYRPQGAPQSPTMSYATDGGTTTCSLAYDISWTWVKSGTGTSDCSVATPNETGWDNKIKY